MSLQTTVIFLFMYSYDFSFLLFNSFSFGTVLRCKLAMASLCPLLLQLLLNLILLQHLLPSGSSICGGGNRGDGVCANGEYCSQVKYNRIESLLCCLTIIDSRVQR